MLNSKEADFILRGDGEVIYPEISKDGLEVYYDVKGKKNGDVHKNKLLDMSGQGKDGELSGFDYDGELSGYDGDNGLVFDGIDDTLKIPKLSDIDADNFTYQLNNNVISYGEGGTVKWVKDGRVKERKGVNLVHNQESQWLGRNSSVVFNSGRIVSEGDGSLAFPQVWQSFEFTEGSKYLSIVEARVLNSECSELRLSNGNYNIDTIKAVGHPTKNVWYELMGVQTVSNSARGVAVYHRYSDEKTSVGKKMEIRNAQVVDLTATFGAGNEPTLEEIQAEPDKWQWLPNPMDLLEAKELGGNILGDMEDIVDASPRDRQSGKEVFTEHADDSHVRVEVDGQSIGGGSGKNLFQKKGIRIGALTLGNSVGEILKKTVRTYVLSTKLDSYSPVKPNTEYTVSWKIGKIEVGQTDGSNAIANRSSGWKSSSPFTFTTGESTTRVHFNIKKEDDSDISLEDVTAWEIQLEEGSTATAYELPAPTPDYPIEIESVNDFDLVSSIGGRNYFSVSFFGSVEGISNPFYSGETDYVYTLEPDTYYTFSTTAPPRGSSGNAYIHFGNFPLRASSSSNGVVHGSPKTILTNSEGKISITINRTDAQQTISRIINGDYKIRLEKGTVATEWTPAPEDITEDDIHPLIDKINLSLSEPLRSVGDVKDRIFKDSNGLWKVERKIKERILRGSEGWVDTSSGNENTQSYYITDSDMFNKISAKSSHFQNHPHGKESDVVGMMSYTGAGTVLAINALRSVVPDVNAWKEWLSNNNVTVLFERKTPIIETLDQELQDQLNTLKSFKGSNYVYTVQNTDNPHKEQLKPTLHATFNSKDYLKETRTLTNLLIWARELSDEELIHHNKLFLNRFNLPSDKAIGEPVEQTLNLLHGGRVGHSLEQNYTINI